MERITISLDYELMDQLDDYLETHGYSNRSEAFRDMVRQTLEKESLKKEEEGDSVGCLTYVYNHNERSLAARLTQTQHDHHDLGLSTLHFHIDHDNCMEISVLRGKTRDIRRFSDNLLAQAGVRHGSLSLIPVDIDHHNHTHNHDRRDDDGQPHIHTRPKI